MRSSFDIWQLTPSATDAVETSSRSRRPRESTKITWMSEIIYFRGGYSFCRAMLCISAAYVVMRCVCVCVCVCLSVTFAGPSCLRSSFVFVWQYIIGTGLCLFVHPSVTRRCSLDISTIFAARCICIVQTIPWQHVCPTVCLSDSPYDRPAHISFCFLFFVSVCRHIHTHNVCVLRPYVRIQLCIRVSVYHIHI